MDKIDWKDSKESQKKLKKIHTFLILSNVLENEWDQGESFGVSL